jgi:hypothetical protein
MEKINMKKQIIAAAVAASVSAVAMADVSITGNANYEWFSTTTGSNNAVYTADTEVNLSVKGKSGDTGVVLNMEFNEDHGGANLDVEDMYLTTKVGDVSVKGGHWSSGTTALGGEIDHGGRATDKLDLGYTAAGWKLGYQQSGGTVDNDSSTITASGNIAGVAVSIKEASDTATYLGATGSLAGIDYRLENKDADAANSDVFFADISTKVGGATVGYTVLDADAAGKISEGDSDIFGLSVNHEDAAVGTTSTTSTPTANRTTAGTSGNRGNVATGAKQIRISAPMAGNTLSAKIGTIEDGLGSGSDLDFTELKLTRALASGATLNIVFDDYDDTTSTSKEVIEFDLSVKF